MTCPAGLYLSQCRHCRLIERKKLVMEVGNVLQLPDRKGCTRGDVFGNVQFPLDMEQVTGIEPA